MVTIKEVISDDRLIVIGRGDEERVVGRSDAVGEEFLRAGDHVRMDPLTGLILEKLIRPEVGELVLEEVPDVTYMQIGGLGDQIEVIRDAIELPYVHKDRFEEYELAPPKGVLLYGPPGMWQDAHRQSSSEQPGEELWPRRRAARTPVPTS